MPARRSRQRPHGLHRHFRGAGLAPEAHRRAVESGPPCIEADADYPSLLTQTGWALRECFDLGAAYAATCRNMLEAFDQRAAELTEVMGPAAYAERRAKFAAVGLAMQEGLQRRELLVAIPERASPSAAR